VTMTMEMPTSSGDNSNLDSDSSTVTVQPSREVRRSSRRKFFCGTISQKRHGSRGVPIPRKITGRIRTDSTAKLVPDATVQIRRPRLLEQ
jgi:hypothetical protein